jgi:hypothetical protein
MKFSSNPGIKRSENPARKPQTISFAKSEGSTLISNQVVRSRDGKTVPPMKPAVIIRNISSPNVPPTTDVRRIGPASILAAVVLIRDIMLIIAPNAPKATETVARAIHMWIEYGL